MKKLLQLSMLLFGSFCFAQTQIGIDINGESADDRTGTTVASSQDGTTIAIGAPRNDGNGADSGHARIFRNISGTWTQWGADINGDAAGDRCGSSVALSSNGSIVAIGSPFHTTTNNGRVKIFSNISGTWTQIGSAIEGLSNNAVAGSSVALSSDGTVVAIGSPEYNGGGTGSGGVEIYRNVSDTWTKIGGTLVGTAINSKAGSSVQLSSNGTVVAFGESGGGVSGLFPGLVKIFRNISGTWTQVGSNITGINALDEFGFGLALSSDGNTVAIGASSHNGNGVDSGQVKVYTNIANVWTQLGANINGEAAGDGSGYSVSLSGNASVLAIGATGNDGTGADSGHVRAYRNAGGVWTQIGTDINGEATGDNFGNAVALSTDGTKLVVGGLFNNGNGSDSGHTRVFDLAALLSNKDFQANNLKFNLYPNPANSILNIDVATEIKQIEIYSLQGQKVLSATQKQVNISGLSTGIYMVKVEDENGAIATQKLVKQ